MGRVAPFDPLDKINLAKSIGAALMEAEPVALGELERFEGPGVYSLYYVGDFYAYEPLAKVNRIEPIAPIYVGKAVSSGARKGGFISSGPQGESLFKRLGDHVKSIEQVSNLALEDFLCRYLVVDDLWIPLGESLLISQHAPVWNVLVEGFGNHDPGKGRRAGARPLWDMLHPGRLWADKLEPNEATAERIGAEALHYLVERYDVIEIPGDGVAGYRFLSSVESSNR